MMYCKTLSEEELFSEFYPDTFSDCLRDIYTSVSEDGSSSEHSSDSGGVNIRPTKRQKTSGLILIWKVKMKLMVLEKTLQVYLV